MDVRNESANLLLADSFERERPPAGASDCLMLWGFGLFYGTGGVGGVYLGRARFEPRLMEQPGAVWSPAHLPPSQRRASA